MSNRIAAQALPPKRWKVILTVTDKPERGEDHFTEALIEAQILGAPREAGIDIKIDSITEEL